MAPRTGPRGVTIEDVQEVADNGRAGYTITRRADRPAVVVPSAADLAGVLAGNAQPGYGEKYGGFPTASQLNAAVTGNVYQLGALQNALAARAGQATSGYQNAAANVPLTAPNMYGSMPSAQERAIGSQLNDVRREIALRDAARTISPERYATGRVTSGPGNLANEALAAAALGGVAAAPFTAGMSLIVPGVIGAYKWAKAGETARPESAVDYTAMRDQVLNAQAGALANRLAAAQAASAQAQASQARQYQQGAQEYLGEKIAAAPEVQLAQTAAAISPSQYAQLVATQQYGVNPAVAAGMFGLDYNTQMLAERQAAANAMLPDFSKSTRELVYEQGGPEALAQYDEQQYAAAMGGTLGQQMSQEETMQELQDAADDNAIYQATQLTPGMVYSNREMADGLRSYMLDPAFQQSVVSARDNALALYQEGEDPAVVAQQAYQEYYEATGDPVAARYIADIAASFAFGS